MTEVFLEAWKDATAMIPFLVMIYVALELVETKFERAVKNLMLGSLKTGPLLGAIFGCVPQCGFSVIAATLYAKRAVSLGTLLAVFLSTSDEAVPVILAQPDKAALVFPVLLVKVVIAIAAGYGVDAFFRLMGARMKWGNLYAAGRETEKDHCCGRPHASKEALWKSFLLYPVWHAFKVFLFILGVSLLINVIIARVGEDGLSRVFMDHTIFQPFIAVLVGLIPNCAASVAVTQIFLEGGISFGSAIAGLCASAGLGLLVLMRENKPAVDSIRVITLFAAISFLAGILINLVG